MKRKQIPEKSQGAADRVQQASQHDITGENYSVWDEDDAAPEWFKALPLEASPHANEAAALIRLEVSGVPLGERLDKWLAAQLAEYSRSRLQQWITAGHVRVNEASASVRQTIWNEDVVTVQPQRSAEASAFLPEAMALDIVHEDAALIVLNKPAGLVVHPAAGNWSGTLLNGLLNHAPQLNGLPRAGIVHRLDKDTSGLMVVAKTLTAQTDLVRQLQARTVKREYLALVHGHPPQTGTVNAPIGRHPGRNPRDRLRMAVFKPNGLNQPGSKPAITHFEVLQRSAQAGTDSTGKPQPLALICCKLETGRTHQIRVHMQSIGYPLVGDPLYGRAGNTGIAFFGQSFARQALHAWQLGLIHPQAGTPCLWRAAPPADFVDLLRTLGFATPEYDT